MNSCILSPFCLLKPHSRLVSVVLRYWEGARSNQIMAYIQVLKVLHRNLQHRAPQVSVLIHTHRRVSTLSRLAFHSGLEANSPVLSCLIQTHRRQGICLDFTARNKSSPEDRDRSVSKFQSGSPKPSAAQKGMQGEEIKRI